jgi:hypothetical protein
VVGAKEVRVRVEDSPRQERLDLASDKLAIGVGQLPDAHRNSSDED